MRKKIVIRIIYSFIAFGLAIVANSAIAGDLTDGWTLAHSKWVVSVQKKDASDQTGTLTISKHVDAQSPYLRYSREDTERIVWILGVAIDTKGTAAPVSSSQRCAKNSSDPYTNCLSGGAIGMPLTAADITALCAGSYLVITYQTRPMVNRGTFATNYIDLKGAQTALKEFQTPAE